MLEHKKNCHGHGLRVILFALATAVGVAGAALGPGGAPAASALDEPVGPSRMLLPVVNRAPNDTLFGVQMDPLTDANGFGQMVAAGASWTRRNGVLWSDVEPTEGARNWGALAELEADLERSARAGLRVVLIVRKTPAWAQEISGSSCGPIRTDKLAAFGVFMRELVARYSVGPYFVKRWEIWNEPDVSVIAGPGNEQEYGCWGDPGDAYFGGGKYADMLAVVTPQIKSADPDARVYVGGLLLDCDPANPPPNKDCAPSKYLEGILRAGGAPFFDGVSFHAYDFYTGGVGNYHNPNWGSSSSTTGPVGIAKARYLRQLMAAYNVTGKELLNTETALLCFGCEPVNIGDDFEGTKSFYVAQTYAVAVRDGLAANIWYNSRGWFFSGLLDDSANPRFAYQAFVTSRKELGSASFSRDITEFPGVAGYAFARPGARVWVMWSPTGAPRAVSLPGTPVSIVDVFGGAVPVTGNALTVESAPVYVVWYP